MLMPLNLYRHVPLAAALALLAGPAAAADIYPELPAPFETVSLRQIVDDCIYDPGTVSVRQEGAKIVVERHDRQCLQPGNLELVDIRLGAFPVGTYEVELRGAHDPEPGQRLRFEVLAPPEIAIAPPPPKPLSDYSGLWMNPEESGWGLSLHMGFGYTLFGTIYVYGPDHEPRWYTLHSGRWLSPTLWQGVVGRSRGTPWLAADLVFSAEHEDAGEATIDFRISPPEHDGPQGPKTATLTYSIDGTLITHPIEQRRF